jgi:LysM repeat protein
MPAKVDGGNYNLPVPAKPAAPPKTGPAAPPTQTHTAPHRQSVGEVAREHGVKRQQIIAANPRLQNQSSLAPGDHIQIPLKPEARSKQYRTLPGDTPKSVAQHHGTTESELREENGLELHEHVYPGTVLNVPGRADDDEDHEHAYARANAAPASSKPPADPVAEAEARTDKAAADAEAAKLPSPGALRDVPRGEREEMTRNAKAAQAELKAAVDAEIKTRMNAPGQPPLTSDTLYASAAGKVTARFAGMPGGALVKETVQQLGTERAAKNAESKANLEVTGQLIRAAETSKTDPAKALADVNKLISTLPPDKQEKVLADSRVQQIVQRAADYAKEPLDEYTQAVKDKKIKPDDSLIVDASVGESTQRTIDMTNGLDPRLAAMVVDKETTNIAQALDSAGVKRDEMFINLQTSSQNLTILAGRTFGAPDSTVVIDRVIGLAGAENWKLDATMYAIGEQGAGPALAIRLGELRGTSDVMNEMVAGQIDAFAHGQIAKDYEEYVKANEELAWLVASEGPSMTADQLKSAVDDYLTKHPDREAQIKAAEAKLAQDGELFIKQVTQLNTLVGGDLTSNKDILKSFQSAAGQDGSMAAIQAALKANPDLITGDAGLTALDSFSAARDVWNKQGVDFLADLGQKYIDNTLIKTLDKLDPKDPATYQAALKELKGLSNDTLATALGTSTKELDKQILKMESIIQPGRDAKRIRQDLNRFERSLSEEGALPVGAQGVFKHVGAMFAVAGFISAGSQTLDEPSLLNGIDTIVNAGEVLDAVLPNGGRIGDSITAALGAKSFGRVLGGAGAAVDTVRAISAFKDHHFADAGFSGAGAAGALLITFGEAAWTGPVGIALVAVSVLGKMQYDRVKDSNKHMNQTTADFLEHAKFDPDAARALSDQTKDGVSAVPLIMEIGKAKGMTREQTVEYINNMSPGELADYRDGLHHFIDWFSDDMNVSEMAQVIASQKD